MKEGVELGRLSGCFRRDLARDFELYILIVVFDSPEPSSGAEFFTENVVKLHVNFIGNRPPFLGDADLVREHAVI